MNLIHGVPWWTSLGKNDLLSLAILLCRHSLDIWKTYAANRSEHSILDTLPADALSAIEQINPAATAYKISSDIKEYFTRYVSPFIQLQDGDMQLAYDVKCSFLSVFYILKGLLSQKSKATLECFSTSVSKSMDAIYISGQMSVEEIEKLVLPYVNISKSDTGQR